MQALQEPFFSVKGEKRFEMRPKRRTGPAPYPPTLISLGSNLGGMMATVTSGQRPTQMAADSQTDNRAPINRKLKDLGRATPRDIDAEISREFGQKTTAVSTTGRARDSFFRNANSKSRETRDSPPPWLPRATAPAGEAKHFEGKGPCVFLAWLEKERSPGGGATRRLPGEKRKAKWGGL